MNLGDSTLWRRGFSGPSNSPGKNLAAKSTAERVTRESDPRNLIRQRESEDLCRSIRHETAIGKINPIPAVTGELAFMGLPRTTVNQSVI